MPSRAIVRSQTRGADTVSELRAKRENRIRGSMNPLITAVVVIPHEHLRLWGSLQPRSPSIRVLWRASRLRKVSTASPFFAHSSLATANPQPPFPPPSSHLLPPVPPSPSFCAYPADCCRSDKPPLRNGTRRVEEHPFLKKRRF